MLVRVPDRHTPTSRRGSGTGLAVAPKGRAGERASSRRQGRRALAHRGHARREGGAESPWRALRSRAMRAVVLASARFAHQPGRRPRRLPFPSPSYAAHRARRRYTRRANTLSRMSMPLASAGASTSGWSGAMSPVTITRCPALSRRADHLAQALRAAGERVVLADQAPDAVQAVGAVEQDVDLGALDVHLQQVDVAVEPVAQADGRDLEAALVAEAAGVAALGGEAHRALGTSRRPRGRASRRAGRPRGCSSRRRRRSRGRPRRRRSRRRGARPSGRSSRGRSSPRRRGSPAPGRARPRTSARGTSPGTGRRTPGDA